MNSNRKQTYCVGGGRKCNTIDIIKDVKVNPKTNKIVKVRKGKCDICGRNISQSFTK